MWHTSEPYKTAEPITMRCRLGHSPVGLLEEPLVSWGTHWRHLVNTVKRHVRGDDTALRQITFTICSLVFVAGSHSLTFQVLIPSPLLDDACDIRRNRPRSIRPSCVDGKIERRRVCAMPHASSKEHWSMWSVLGIHESFNLLFV